MSAWYEAGREAFTNLQSLSELVYDEWCPGWRGDDSASFAKEEPTQERFVVVDRCQTDLRIPECPTEDARDYVHRDLKPEDIVHGDRPDLAERVSAKVGTPYLVVIERRMATRSWQMTATCNRCDNKLSVECYDDDSNAGVEAVQAMADHLARCILDCREEDCCEIGDCTCVDGLTEEECLERYTMLQRDFVPPHGLSPRDCLAWLRNNQLTVSQLEAGANAWSRSLREKQERARQKERAEVVCERDEDGL